ncbi:ATP binding domain 4 [Boothiomyces macroporosus]|uniref:Diphthine--ammonia ligase n=1 Tax=Boothiomyces macroporosus TaxID=261099 RepID=A0AAD5Y5N4_9FUNG|nr:ATP binding domain 4 [Boothiomyces macroporosus]
MKLVGLISGGKDSCYNMIECKRNGHEIVALANLSSPVELDSHMFQTIGVDLIQHYAECVGVQLYSHALRGKSLTTTQDYSFTENDEVEDLYQLLSLVKKEKGIEGVSCGAILSNYQRVRLESVCKRLGLVAVCYLWQRDQTLLLRDMMEDVDAILVKVACHGLNARHVGKSIKAIGHELMGMDGINVCGEGGEYETMTLDCKLFKKKIELIETNVVKDSDDYFAPVCYMNMIKAKVADKEREIIEHKEPEEFQIEWQDIDMTIPNVLTGTRKVVPYIAEKTVVHRHPYLAISGITEKNIELGIESSKVSESITNATDQVMLYLKQKLEEYGYSFSNVVLMNVFVKDMSNFSLLNQAYEKYFGINPSPRVTVETLLSSEIQIDLLAFKSNSISKDTLHVQGISYWAPANIGPYSQACRVGDIMFMAGMIGLTPSSMMLDDSITAQCRTSLTSLTNVCKSMKTEIEKSMSCVCYVTDPSSIYIAKQYWKQVCDGPILYVVVPRLPRDAKVEWHLCVSSHSGYNEIINNHPDTDPSKTTHVLPTKRSCSSVETQGSKITVDAIKRGFSGFILGTVDRVHDLSYSSIIKLIQKNVDELDAGDWVFLKIFHQSDIDIYGTWNDCMKREGKMCAVTFVPVESVHNGIVSFCLFTTTLK